MSYRSDKRHVRDILDYVLPEYQRVTEAPLSVEEMPGYSREFSAGEREQFTTQAIAAERSRRYKAMDADGNVYLVGNPWARRLETRPDGTVWVVHPKPERVLSYSQAKRMAAENATKIDKFAAASSKSQPSSSTKTEFDY